MDFYITKYQGKQMESLTPLFRCMTDGVHRLERQEEQEEAEAESARKAAADETGLEPAPKQQKTVEDITRRARRLTIRLASMANRCFWVSAAELTVHILTDGDCLQSHNNITIFTRQLQWAMQQSKKFLNNETLEEDTQQALRNVQTVAVHVPDVDQAEQHEVADGAQVVAQGMLRGLHDTFVPMLFALFGYWVIGIGVGAWLAFERGWGGVGIWTGLATGLSIVAVLMLTRWMQRERLGLVRQTAPLRESVAAPI